MDAHREMVGNLSRSLSLYGVIGVSGVVVARVTARHGQRRRQAVQSRVVSRRRCSSTTARASATAVSAAWVHVRSSRLGQQENLCFQVTLQLLQVVLPSKREFLELTYLGLRWSDELLLGHPSRLVIQWGKLSCG